MIARQLDENPAGIHLPLDPLPGHSSRGRLERVLRRGEFAVTTELNPPDSADPEDVYNRAKIFDGWVDAINAVDASGANCHMSSVGICALLTRMGYAPIMQIACRDRNRIAAPHLAASFPRLHPDARHVRLDLAIAVGAHTTARTVPQSLRTIHRA